MSGAGLLASWMPQGKVAEGALSAGWWLADPLGAMGQEWIGTLADGRHVIHLDDVGAEAALGIPGPDVELARLLSHASLEHGAHRVVVLHAQLLAAHGQLLYFTRNPQGLGLDTRGWLVAAARAGGSRILSIVKDERELPLDWSAGRQPALTKLPTPRVDAWELATRMPDELSRSVPLFSLAAFVAACGSRLDVAELALAELDTQEARRHALLTGTAGRKRQDGALDRSLAALVSGLPEQERELGARLASSVGSLPLTGEDIAAAMALQELGLATPVAVGGRPHARPASELMRTAFPVGEDLEGALSAQHQSGPTGSLMRWLGRLDRANEAMDAEAGSEPARRLRALRRHWGENADLVQALILEHAFLLGGAIGCLRTMRTVETSGPLARAAVVRVSLESGQLYNTVREMCVRYLGLTPKHRDDDVVLDLLPASAMREDYRKGLVAGEKGDLRGQAVAYARILRAAHRPLPHKEQRAALKTSFERRLFRVSAGQGLLWALGMGGYRRELDAVASALVRVGRPWHGALAGVHELALAADDSQRGHPLSVARRLAAAAHHARAWHHGTVERAVSLLSVGAWASEAELPEDVQGAALRGRAHVVRLIRDAVYGDHASIAALAVLEARDPAVAAAALWAQAVLQWADPLDAACQLADAGQDIYAVWLAEAAFTLDSQRVSPLTMALGGQAGRAQAQTAIGFPVFAPLVLPSALTQREAQIERARLAGEDSEAIAQSLSLSVRTVETHRAAARAKAQRLIDLGFTHADAVRWCLELVDASTIVVPPAA